MNEAVADDLDRLGLTLELLGENGFKVNAHHKAARAVRGLGTDIASIATNQDKLTEIDGIGAKIADKIRQRVETGKIAELQEASEKVPPGLLTLLEIPGLGAKTVRLAWENLDITDLDGLKKAIDDGSLATLPRMGAKSVEKIKGAIEIAESLGDRVKLGPARRLAHAVLDAVRNAPGVTRAELAGSLRRGKETVGDLDVLAIAEDAQPVMEAFRSMEVVSRVIASGPTKTSVVAAIPGGGDRWGEGAGDGMQVDLRVVSAESFGAAWLYFTGSKEHNVRLRERSIKQGLRLNEYALWRDTKDDEEPVRVAGTTEDEVYDALGLAWIPPELREDHGEFDRAPPADLIELSDIKAELHAHTTASDGAMSLDELIDAAQARGYHTIAVTDHSRSSVQANGLSVERLREQIEQVRAANVKRKKITVLAGSEVDILTDGSLDYDDELLAELDIVVASPHAALSQNPATATRRLLRAIEHPSVRILGHPTGRLIGRRTGLEPAMDEIIAAAVEHDVALEINAHWMRLDLRDTHVRMAVEAGALIAINCDTHALVDMDHIDLGVATARRGRLPAERCINCWDVNRLRAWLKR